MAKDGSISLPVISAFHNLLLEENKMKISCSDCRFWSELVARNEGLSVQAMCLCEDSPHYTQYTLDKHGCDLGLSALWGSIDAPGNEHAYDPYPQKTVE